MITKAAFLEIVDALRLHPDPLNGMSVDEHIAWSENAGPPSDAEDFALEAIFVICNSGMKHTVARKIFEKCREELLTGGGDAGRVFGHAGKATAINEVWRRRNDLFSGYMQAADKVAFCETIPWIGKITKYHLAKNFGADVAKPDVHLARLAAMESTTPQLLCEELARASGLKVRTVDLILWMACAKGLIDPR